jgi:hypothetical protein
MLFFIADTRHLTPETLLGSNRHEVKSGATAEN